MVADEPRGGGALAVLPVDADGWRAELGVDAEGDPQGEDERASSAPASRAWPRGSPAFAAAPARCSSPPPPPTSSRAAAWACSRPAPAWARASPTCCRRPSPAPPPAAASSSARRPRPCSASWPRTSCPSSPRRCRRAGAGRCSWAARTTSAGGGSTRPSPPRARRCRTASARSRSPTSSGGRAAARSTSRRCRTAPPRSCRALAELARELRSSRATCLGRHCPSRRGCHWRLARSRAEAAHLVCVNHALLLTGPETLPPFEDVVIDEAHLLYHEATEAFSEEIDARTLDLLLADLRGRRRQRPLPLRLRAAARRAEPGEARALAAAADACERAARAAPRPGARRRRDARRARRRGPTTTTSSGASAAAGGARRSASTT